MTRLAWAGLLAAVPLALLAAVSLGTLPLPPVAVWQALLGEGTPLHGVIVREVRLPRALLAALVGAGLGLAGTAMQGTTRNPLAEPYLLGVSGGAAVGAVVAILLGVPLALLPIAAFAGAAAAVLVAVGVAHAAGRAADPRVLVMAGVVVGAFANAVIMVLLADASPDVLRGALWWMMGSAADASWSQVGWLAAYVVFGGGLLVARARDLDLLALGDESAAALGVDVERAARRAYLTGALLAAATVSAAGLVGFVGLVVPHLGRALGLRRHRELLAGAALIGAALVVAADLAARTLRAPAELPLGAVTALVGVPFFLARLRRLA